jgi:hypothetical protein
MKPRYLECAFFAVIIGLAAYVACVVWSLLFHA